MIPWRGTAWRLIDAATVDRATLPVASPEGRFHHDGQPAIYTSLTPEGCGIAIRRYLRTDDAPCLLVPLTVAAARLVDLRGAGAAPSVVWQDSRASGALAPTWALSDAGRDRGAQGMFYRSRSRPDLVHLVLFDPAAIRDAGPATAWVAEF